MIRFTGVSKSYRTRDGVRPVLADASFSIAPGTALAICGANGAGKSTLLRLMAGVEAPSRGRIERQMSVSWPLGHASAFQSSLSGADNTRFIARIYGRDLADTLAFVEDFAELGAYLREPVRSYSAGMQARLAFAVSLAVDFDCYLVDEIVTAGDQRFQQRCHDALMARRDRATLVMVSHDPVLLRLYCRTGATLVGGRLSFHPDIDTTFLAHAANMQMAIA